MTIQANGCFGRATPSGSACTECQALSSKVSVLADRAKPDRVLMNLPFKYRTIEQLEGCAKDKQDEIKSLKLQVH